MARINELVLPSTGPRHKLFGVKYLKYHNMREAMWSVPDKVAQYDGVIQLFERNQKLLNQDIYDRLDDIREDYDATRQEVTKNYREIDNTTRGNAYLIRKAFLNHKLLQRCYMKMTPQDILRNIDHKTFNKRKQLDRLNCWQRQLMEEYETKLLSLGGMQDYEFSPKAEQKRIAERSKWLDVEIKAAQTRTRAVRTINKAYRMMLDILHKDSTYYNAVLSAITSDMAEQKKLIEYTLIMGGPALKNVRKLGIELESWQRYTEKDLEMRHQSLTEAAEALALNKIKVKHLVREDSDFELNADRYDRDTPSMTDLKTDMKQVNLVIQKLVSITSVRSPEAIFPRMEKQVVINNRLFSNLIKANDNRNHLNTKKSHGETVKETLFNDLTEAEIKRLKDMQRFSDNIELEEKKQKTIDKNVMVQEEILYLIQGAFQHMTEVLRHIGDRMKNPRRLQYPVPTLQLPLLDFGVINPKRKRSPKFMEEDLDALIEVINTKLGSLMARYVKDKPSEEVKESVQGYAVAIMNKQKKGSQQPSIKIEAYLDDSEMDQFNANRGIPTRLQIKAMSAKIVEANLKTDDD